MQCTKEEIELDVAPAEGCIVDAQHGAAEDHSESEKNEENTMKRGRLIGKDDQ